MSELSKEKLFIECYNSLALVGFRIQNSKLSDLLANELLNFFNSFTELIKERKIDKNYLGEQMVIKIDNLVNFISILRETTDIEPVYHLSALKSLLKFKLHIYPNRFTQKKTFPKKIKIKLKENDDPHLISKKNKESILEYIKQINSATSDEISKNFPSVKSRTIRRYIQEMQKSGEIVRARRGNVVEYKVNSK
jgi:predicted transcriptional regulator